MKIKTILIVVLMGGSLVFTGLPVDEVIPADELNTSETFSETLALLSFLSLMGYALYLIILILEKLTGLKLMEWMLSRQLSNPRREYKLAYA